MLASALKEVRMGKQAKGLASVALMTLLEAAVVIHCGGTVWKALSTIIWSKLLLLLLATGWATTHLHVWFQAFARLRQDNERHPVVESLPARVLPAHFAEESNV